MEGLLRQVWKEIHPITQRHGDGRNLDPTPRKRRVILERCEAAAVFQGDRPNGSPPKFDLCQRHGSSPHCHSLDVTFAFLFAEARCRFRPRNFSCSTGLGTGSGTSRSKRSIASSTRHTRMKPDNCVATLPDSNRSTVRLETPACAASWACVRFRSKRTWANRQPNSLRTASSVACFVI